MRVSGKVGNVQLMQRINRARVVDCIRRADDEITRPQLAAETGLSLSSITNIINYLIDHGFIAERAVAESTRPGRRASLLGMSDTRWRIACIVAEAHSIYASLMTLSGTVVTAFPYDLPSDTPLTGDGALNAILSLRDRLLNESDGSVLGLAVSVPGMVTDRGSSVTSIAFQWSGVNLRQILENGCSVPVFIQNSSFARAICIRHEIRRDKPANALFIDLEHGIGAVHFAETVLDPTFLGEIGHVTADIHGERCFCGNRGCLELFCTPERIAADYGAASYEEVVKAGERGDEKALTYLERGGRYLGAALVTLIQLFAPDILYIHGYELLESRLVSETAEQYVREHAYPELARRVVFRHVSLDEHSTLSGLLDYALDRLFDVESSKCILE